MSNSDKSLKSLIFRKMTRTDIDAVTKIYQDIYDAKYISFGELAAGLATTPDLVSPNAITIFHQSLIDGITDEQARYFVAISQEKVVGFAIGSLHPIDTSDQECWLDDLGVHPEYQGQGIGKKLVEQVILWGQEQKVAYFLLESGINNLAAHHFFEREEIGFQPLAIVFWKKNSDLLTSESTLKEDSVKCFPY